MELTELALTALGEYGREGATLTLLRHNENAVYRVEGLGGAIFVLRLPTPAPGLSAGQLMHQRDWLESELRWLEALDRGSDIGVQRPMRTEKGALLAEVSEGTLASLLQWLPGEPLNQRDENAAELAQRAGELAARLHNFVLDWPEGSLLPRPAYDGARIAAAMDRLRRGVALGLFGEDSCRVLNEGAERIAMLTDRENRTPAAHGLIHGDLGLGNLIVCGGKVSPIDFGLCGHGPLLMDVGGMLGAFDFPALRRAMLTGYRSLRPIPPAQEPVVEAFFLASIYFFMALHLENPPIREWFGRRLPIILREYIDPFRRGEGFLQSLLE